MTVRCSSRSIDCSFDDRKRKEEEEEEKEEELEYPSLDNSILDVLIVFVMFLSSQLEELVSQTMVLINKI